MTDIDIDSDIVRGYVAAAKLWWLFLLIGAAWLIFSIVVFRFSYTSVSAISILFGVVVMVAGIDELFTAFAGGEGGWMKVARLLLALALIVIGILAFVHPGDTFRALAAVMSFYFILKGMFTTVVAFMSRHVMHLWWLWLLLGLAEILIGFWAAGDFGNRAILLVVWVGVLALTRGISAIIFAFEVRNLKHEVEVATA
jgi:uncharacterized membrane protein HdeD (DUF308 family)